MGKIIPFIAPEKVKFGFVQPKQAGGWKSGDRCPMCGATAWIVGRMTVECAQRLGRGGGRVCGAILPIAGAD